MNFDATSYINTLLDNFTRNHAYYSYLKLKKCKSSSDKYFALPYTQNLLSEEYQLYSIICSSNACYGFKQHYSL